MAILESDGWKYSATFVKAYPPNGVGQTLNEDPNITVLQIDNTPIYCDIPGLTAASGNQIPLPENFEYLVSGWFTAGANSGGANYIIPILWDATISDKIMCGSERYYRTNTETGNYEVQAQFKTTSLKLIELRALKVGPASTVSIRRDNSSLAFSNSVAGLDVRATIKILAK